MPATPEPNLGYRLALAALPPLYVGLTRLWFATCRLTVHGRQYLDEALQNSAVIVPFWHYSIFYMLYHVRHYPAVALVSASRDGEFIARIARRLGFLTVRGSSNRKGVQALKGLLRAMREGRNVGLVADGSQGPARRVRPGAVYLASKTGAPLVPMVWAADRCTIFGSWDRTVLPWPFCRIVMRYGKPLHVPNNLDNEGLEQYRQLLEEQMNEMYEQVWREFGRTRHDDGPGAVTGS
ncbi:MAG: DUF374 domain-containing protein [Desulfobulbus sp.]|jgi:lysophospholipid acyltransferase (LPLAT)-like uncharacterized protein|nr:MAG: DUF374 domain-containing protein [Desulfobulbus sp.]